MAYPKLGIRLAATLLVLVALMSTVGFLAARRMREISESIDTVYKDRVVCQQQLRVIGDAYGLHIADTVNQAREGLLTPAEALRRIDAEQRAAAQQWAAYKQTYLVERERLLVEQAEPLLRRADAAVAEVRQLLASGDVRGLDAFERRDMRAAFSPLAAIVDDLFAIQEQVSRVENQRSREAYRNTVWTIVGLIGVAIMLGGLLTWTVMVRYAAETRDNERRTKRLSAFYAALSRTNRLIVREHDATHLLQELCAICTETGHASLACVSLIDGDRGVRTAVTGTASAFFDEMPVTWNLALPDGQLSTTGNAMRDGVRAISQDYQREAPAQAWRERAARHGIRALAAFPLYRGGRVFGALALYAPETNFFDEPLIRLLDEMVGDVSFALDNIDREAVRARLQRETESSLERFRTLFLASPVPSVITTLANARMLEANDAYCERHDLVREELIGRTMTKSDALLFPEDIDAYMQCLRRDGRVRNMEVRARLKSGNVATLLLNAEKIDYGGEPCVLAMGLDVTELRDAERAREAQAAAEAASRAKTGFISRMSHELRTPLNAMLGFTQLMQQDARARLTLQDLARLDHIHQAGWHLLSLVNDVLDVSRVESGRFDVRRSALALAPILDEALQITEPLARRSGITLGAAYRNMAPIGVDADPVRLRQVLINLLSNAVKYNRPGGSVHVQARSADGMVVVEVLDTGLGMTAEQLEHLYEPFNRLGRERGGIEGTGLGLTLTRQLMSLMGGELAIESQSGRGTTARLILPATGVPEPTTTAGAGPPSEREASTQGLVLYIEDNEINVMVVEQMLGRWRGVRFVHAPDGQSGIDQARLLQPDLVLLDMQLPDMTGPDVLRRLREDESTRKLSVVALSASAMPEEVESAYANGAMDYWTKPLELQRFLNDVARALETSACSRSRSPSPSHPAADRR